MQTFLVPYVQNEEEARKAVAATRYPPRGVRGFAGTTRASRFGRVKDYHTRCEEEICVLVQVETRVALDNLEAIAGVEGVDGVFIGPGDLSAGLGYLGELTTIPTSGGDRRHYRADQGRGQHPGHPDRRRNAGAALYRAGCLFTAVGGDVAILARGAEQLAQRFKNGTP